ncbi:hypothetical protein Nit79A3_1403 [Nitrosomonas sp. Is79A3]|uniref:hypothetical protein n=1 Tax=Nitrosomonas sp. (strain Is79A3) TaxID=261292 RepID=UPI000215CFDC
MQHKSHKRSWISVVSDHVEGWKSANKWSRETTAEAIVNKYHEIYPNGLPGVEEFSNHPDMFTRNRVNATRIFRWLDDRTKDKNFLDSNFLSVILQALPDGIRLHCLNEMLRPMDIVAGSVEQQGIISQDKPISHLKSLIKESAEACHAITDLIDGETYDELVKAQQELIDLERSVKDARALVDSKLSALNVKSINAAKN